MYHFSIYGYSMYFFVASGYLLKIYHLFFYFYSLLQGILYSFYVCRPFLPYKLPYNATSHSPPVAFTPRPVPPGTVILGVSKSVTSVCVLCSLKIMQEDGNTNLELPCVKALLLYCTFSCLFLQAVSRGTHPLVSLPYLFDFCSLCSTVLIHS